MAPDQNIAGNMEEQLKTGDQYTMEEQQFNEEEKITKKLNNITVSESDTPDQSTLMSQDTDQAESLKEEPNSPMQEDFDFEDISDICGPFDKNEMFAESNLNEPLSKYYCCEWSAVEHIFMPIIEFAEEMYNEEWSPCPSPKNGVGP